MKKNSNNNTKKTRKYRSLILVMMLALALTACGTASTATTQSQTTEAVVSQTSTGSEDADNGEGGTETADEDSTGMAAEDTDSAANTSDSSDTSSGVDVSELFSDRDLAGTWDESEAIAITLNGDTAACDSSNVTVESGTVTINAEGTYVLSGNLNGMVIVDVEDTEKVQLVLNGVNITSATSAAIYVRSADKVFVTLAEGSENTLTNGGSYEAIDDNNIDAVIFSKDDITLNGAGSLTINANAGHGVVGKDELTITGGTYTITAEKNGLNGKDSVCIADGTFTITAGQDAIHGDNDEDESKGYVYIGGGTYTISAGDDGIHASSGLAIVDGTIDITKSYEGLEGMTIDVLGGTINIVASDDGLNSAGGNDSSGSFGGDMFASNENCNISITGGTINVNAEGDGIDSNGNITISGGTTCVSGPTGDGNGALDYNGTAEITAGTLIAASSSGMAQNLNSSQNQGSMLIYTGQQSAGTAVTVTDESGNVVAEYTPEKAYACVVISTEGLAQGGTYTVTAGSYTETVTLDTLIYGSGNGMGGFGGGMGRGMKGKGKMPGGNSGNGGFSGGPANGQMPGGNNSNDGQ